MDQQGQTPTGRRWTAVQGLLTQEFVAAGPVHLRRRLSRSRFAAAVYRPFFRLLVRARSMLRGCTERPNFLRTISARSFARRLWSSARC
jgi:hypothetical protein